MEDIQRLLSRWPGDSMQLKHLSTEQLLEKLTQALAAEHRKARRQAWTSDPVRCRALARAIKAIRTRRINVQYKA